MGTLFYGSGRLPISIDDTILAHVKILATSKARRGEGFLISWADSPDVGHGRSSVWVHPGADLHYKFDGSRPPSIDQDVLEELHAEANRARGIELVHATLLHDPRGRSGRK